VDGPGALGRGLPRHRRSLASGPKTAEQLAAATGTVPHPLYRVLRALASLGVFAERGDGRIENTAASETLRADVPRSTRDYVIFFARNGTSRRTPSCSIRSAPASPRPSASSERRSGSSSPRTPSRRASSTPP
jgi:hypothetical protein